MCYTLYSLLYSPEKFISTIEHTVIITGRNEVVAKVMFLQVCVCPQGGRVSASVHAGMPYPPRWRTPPRDGEPPRWRTPPMENPPNGEPPGWRTPRMENPPDGEPPPGSRLQHTVYERPVRILLECILVYILCLQFILWYR